MQQFSTYITEDQSIHYHKAQEEIIELLKKYGFSVYIAKEILKDTLEQLEIRSKLV